MKKAKKKKHMKATAIQGAKTYGMPVALTSTAVAAPIFLTSSGSLFARKKFHQGCKK